MPQTPSPNMSIIWPTDNDDANQWAPIMDTAIRVVVDGHNHSPGSGAKVNISSLAVDADIPFIDAGGGKHAITSMKAISFFPSPPPVGINGSFFIADGTSGTVANELYYRTTLGTNVQITVAGTLNVGAFAGTIGGDYTGVAALEIFDDASDAYWFQQQVGAAVRQYAKMRCSDLSLFEFKAVGASPVPTNAVTLKSPAALAAGYALTFPGALPGSSGTLIQSDNTGLLSFSNLGLAATTFTGAVTANSTITANGNVTVSAGQTLTMTDGATALKNMNHTVTQGIDLADCLIISGSVASQPAPQLVGITIPAGTAYSYRWRIQPRSHETITGLSAVFSSSGGAGNVTSVALKYMDHAYSKTTVTGISFTQSGQSWVMSGSPSVTLNGPAGRVYFMEVTTGGGGSATWYGIEMTLTT